MADPLMKASKQLVGSIIFIYIRIIPHNNNTEAVLTTGYSDVNGQRYQIKE